MKFTYKNNYGNWWGKKCFPQKIMRFFVRNFSSYDCMWVNKRKSYENHMIKLNKKNLMISYEIICNHVRFFQPGIPEGHYRRNLVRISSWIFCRKIPIHKTTEISPSFLGTGVFFPFRGKKGRNMECYFCRQAKKTQYHRLQECAVVAALVLFCLLAYLSNAIRSIAVRRVTRNNEKLLWSIQILL